VVDDHDSYFVGRKLNQARRKVLLILQTQLSPPHLHYVVLFVLNLSICTSCYTSRYAITFEIVHNYRFERFIPNKYTFHFLSRNVIIRNTRIIIIKVYWGVQNVNTSKLLRMLDLQLWENMFWPKKDEAIAILNTTLRSSLSSKNVRKKHFNHAMGKELKILQQIR
jgi:hypothetical protein